MADERARVRRKTSTKGTRKRQEIRSAAYRCFRDRGYHETSVDAICEKAGISKGSLYWHYESKQEVFIDILETWTREVMDELYEQFQEALDQPDYVGAITRAFQRESRRGRVIVPLWLEFAVHARRDPKIREALSRFHRRSRTAIAEMLRPALKDELNEDELQGVASAIFGAYTGLLTWELSEFDSSRPPQAFGQVMGVLGRLLQRVNTSAGQIGIKPHSEAEGTEDGSSAGAQIVGVLGRLFRRVHAGETAALTRHQKADSAIEGARVEEEEIKALLALMPQIAHEQVFTLRRLVLESAPDASERLTRGKKALGYIRGGTVICRIEPRQDATRVTFENGIAISDPEAKLRGKGLRTRYFDLPHTKPVPVPAFAALVRQASKLAEKA